MKNRDRAATLLLVSTALVAAVAFDGPAQTIAVVAAAVATVAGVVREVRTR